MLASVINRRQQLARWRARCAAITAIVVSSCRSATTTAVTCVRRHAIVFAACLCMPLALLRSLVIWRNVSTDIGDVCGARFVAAILEATAAPLVLVVALAKPVTRAPLALALAIPSLALAVALAPLAFAVALAPRTFALALPPLALALWPAALALAFTRMPVALTVALAIAARVLVA